MNAERLQQLARVVREADPQLFDMRNLCYCAGAFAQRDPWMRSQGLNVQDTEVDFEALRRFFDLTPDQNPALFAGLLCSDSPPVSKHQVLANIDRLLQGEEPIPYPERADEDA